MFCQWFKGRYIEVGQGTCNNTVIFKPKCPFHSIQQDKIHTKIECHCHFNIKYVVEYFPFLFAAVSISSVMHSFIIAASEIKIHIPLSECSVAFCCCVIDVTRILLHDMTISVHLSVLCLPLNYEKMSLQNSYALSHNAISNWKCSSQLLLAYCNVPCGLWRNDPWVFCWCWCNYGSWMCLWIRWYVRWL